MPAVTITSKGSFQNTEKFLDHVSKTDIFAELDAYAREGVVALAAATPVDSGLTAQLWDYEISHSFGKYTITWTNTHIVKGVPIAIILQYGHGTGTGGYVQGRDYINPAIRPIFDKISDHVWKVVTSS
jgi:hypothetical protein